MGTDWETEWELNEKLNGKFQILRVSSEISGTDQSESTLLKIVKCIFSSIKIYFHVKNRFFFFSFAQITSKVYIMIL